MFFFITEVKVPLLNPGIFEGLISALYLA